MKNSTVSITGTQQSLAAVLIARDEARCIARCLESVRPWVDSMVVLDTGSRDDTVQLAKACGAQVHHLDWPDDFSAARNHALDIAGADWNLIIDADEWIMSGGDTLRQWCSGSARLGRICIHSSFDPASGAGGSEAQSTRSWLTRLLPRGVRFEGRVHEQAMSPLPREDTHLHVGHDGYRDAQMADKKGRNEPLLLKELLDRPDDPYLLYQLGKEAETGKRHKDAAGLYERSFDRTPANANWRHELLIRYLHCLGQAGEVGRALGIADEQMPAWQDSPDFFFVLGNLLLDQAMADPANAIDQWLPLATVAWERCLIIGERPDLEGSVEGRGSHLAQHNLDIIRAQVGALAG